MPNNHLKRGTSPILYTQENTDGWFLEDLLEQAIKDLSAKEEFMLANYVPGPAMDNYLASNKRVSELMAEAAKVQKESIMFARNNPLAKIEQNKSGKQKSQEGQERQTKSGLLHGEMPHSESFGYSSSSPSSSSSSSSSCD